jgi:hypothetical protein
MSFSYLDFYSDVPNDDGLSIKDVWKFSSHDYEKEHNFIQWAFPSDEPSSINPWSPVVKYKDMITFRLNVKLRLKLLRSFRQFLMTLGLQMQGDKITIANNGVFYLQVLRPNHNLQRISRVLRSLYLLGHEQRARTFMAFLQNVHSKQGVNEIAYGYWERVFERELPCRV